MPVETEDRLKALLSEGRITAVTLDTNVFDGQRLNFKSGALRAAGSLKERPFPLILSGTVVREVQGHVTKAMDDALPVVKKAVGGALFAFDTSQPKRDDILAQITGGRSPTEAAEIRVGEFLKDSACEVLDDAALVNVASVFDAYFNRQPPFSHGKKAEFPDALALKALDHAATTRRTGFLVVSEDNDWKAFCISSRWLYWVPKLEKALSLINDAPIGLRRAIVAWFGDGEDGRAEVNAAISSHLEMLDVDASAYASVGEVEASTWAPEVLSVEWPYDSDIEIIETEELADGRHRVMVSLPMGVNLRFSVDLNFSIWDGVDRESVSMGGRTIEVDREEDLNVTATIVLGGGGGQAQHIELIDTEFDVHSLDVDVGEVDTFEPEDYEP